MDIRKVKKLIELLETSNVAEIEIHEGEESVRISRHGTQPPPMYMPHMMAPPPQGQLAQAATPAARRPGRRQRGAGGQPGPLPHGRDLLPSAGAGHQILR